MSHLNTYMLLPMLRDLKRLADEADDFDDDVLYWAHEFISKAVNLALVNEIERKGEKKDARKGLAQDLGLGYTSLVKEHRDFALCNLVFVQMAMDPTLTPKAAAEHVQNKLPEDLSGEIDDYHFVMAGRSVRPLKQHDEQPEQLTQETWDLLSVDEQWEKWGECWKNIPVPHLDDDLWDSSIEVLRTVVPHTISRRRESRK